MLGDLAVLLGAFCCFERYWSELIGTIPRNEESGISGQIVRFARLNPEASMRQLVQRCGVRWKAYVEVRQLRRQLIQICKSFPLRTKRNKISTRGIKPPISIYKL